MKVFRIRAFFKYVNSILWLSFYSLDLYFNDGMKNYSKFVRFVINELVLMNINMNEKIFIEISIFKLRIKSVSLLCSSEYQIFKY